MRKIIFIVCLCLIVCTCIWWWQSGLSQQTIKPQQNTSSQQLPEQQNTTVPLTVTNQISSPQIISDNFLQLAYIAYQNHKFSEAATQFSSFLQKNKDSSETEILEAKIGHIISLLRNSDGDWQKQLSISGIIEHGYWQGKAFSYSQYLSESNIKHLQQKFITELANSKELVIVAILTQHFCENYLTNEEYSKAILAILQNSSTGIKQNTLTIQYLHEYCLFLGWQLLRLGYSHAGFYLFSSLSLYDPILKKECQYGMALAQILDPTLGNISQNFVDSLEFNFETRSISLLRTSSILQEYETAIKKNKEQWKDWTLCDMIFMLGATAPKPFEIWQEGYNFILSQISKHPAEAQIISDNLQSRFEMAIAWSNFVRDNLTQSIEIWTRYEKNLDAKWQQESKLGLALASWRMGQNLAEIAPKLNNINLEADFFLAGYKVSFYRYTHRQANKTQFENLCLNEEIKIGFLLMDVLSILGDGRGAYSILGHIIQLQPDLQYQSLYEAEENNLPKDPYAENQIWEKLD